MRGRGGHAMYRAPARPRPAAGAACAAVHGFGVRRVAPTPQRAPLAGCRRGRRSGGQVAWCIGTKCADADPFWTKLGPESAKSASRSTNWPRPTLGQLRPNSANLCLPWTALGLGRLGQAIAGSGSTKFVPMSTHLGQSAHACVVTCVLPCCASKPALHHTRPGGATLVVHLGGLPATNRHHDIAGPMALHWLVMSRIATLPV